MITGIRVQNLRSICDSGMIRLAKINVLVGRNSAGKSTLLRVFPLLRQSMEQATKGPILWYGRLVDFGDFQNAVRRGADGRSISFEFEVEFSIDRQLFRRNVPGVARKFRRNVEARVELIMGRGRDDKVGAIREINIAVGSDRVKVALLDDDVNALVSINGLPVDLGRDRYWWVGSGRILPQIYLMKTEVFFDEHGEQETHESFDDAPFSGLVANFLQGMFGLDVPQQRVKAAADMLAYCMPREFGGAVRELRETLIGEADSAWSPDEEDLQRLREIVLRASLSRMLAVIDDELSKFAENVRYLEPLRATAERYYRLQDLAVGEIDSRGANVAMFVNSLSWHEKESLRSWMSSTLGFHVQVTQGVGHVEVEIVTKEGVTGNLADIGFGYSQLLPIILQLWKGLVAEDVFISGPGTVGQILVVEQPELHLHPQYQALLADTLAAVLGSSTSGNGIFLAETHSEHFVNRLGELIGEGKLSPDDVQILVIEQQEGVASVTRAPFSDAGFLNEGWPAGFFVPRRSNASLA